VTAGLLLWVVPDLAFARDREPIVVVVEVTDGEVDRDALLRELRKRLARPVLSLFDEGTAAATGVLGISLHFGRGEARVQYRTPEASLVWRAVTIPRDADPAALWLVAQAVAVVRAAEQQRDSVRLTSCMEVIDPWRHHGPPHWETEYRLPSEVLDPFDSRRVRAAYDLPSEVIDPWGTPSQRRGDAPSTKSGRRLAPPSPGW
jgi:hypothetical protein